VKQRLATRRDFLQSAGLCAAWVWTSSLSGCASPSQAPAAKGLKPNIIFILADDLGYGDLGCYGQKEIQTPHLDRLAASGVRFTDHYSGSTVCAPSRCVLMTGLHTGHAYIRGNSRSPIRPQDRTVAEILQVAGYTTGLIGKWGLGENGSEGIPNRKGFDYFYGYESQVHAHNYYTEFLWRNQDKVALKNIVERPSPTFAEGLGGVSTNKVEYSADLFAEESLQFVEKNRQSPFFLYLTYTIPHANNEAKNEGMEVPDLGIYKDKPWPAPQKGHAAMITRMDSHIGRLLDKLAELKIADRTLVVFSSDNGPHKEGGFDPDFNHSSGPLRGIKRDLYDGGIRVPLIASWPGTVPPGRTSDLVSAFWDFLPTACDVAGIKTPEGLDGISYLPTLLGKPDRQKLHEYLYWEFYERGFDQAVRMGQWKAVRNGVAGPLELYDLLTDIGETKNVAADHPDIVAQIEAILKTARTESEIWKIPDAGATKPKPAPKPKPVRKPTATQKPTTIETEVEP
jgi:arylsulfatase A-like enzyme